MNKNIVARIKALEHKQQNKRDPNRMVPVFIKLPDGSWTTGEAKRVQDFTDEELRAALQFRDEHAALKPTSKRIRHKQ